MKKIFSLFLSMLVITGCSTAQLETKETTVNEFPFEVEVIAENLIIPWSVALSGNGDLYFTERNGFIKVIEKGKKQPKTLIKFESPFVMVGEGGLQGLVLHPDFESNHYLYTYYTYQDNKQLFNRVVRLIKENEKITIDQVLLDRIPGRDHHNGGRLKIGPDKKLYITTGDAGNAMLAQDLTSLAGKILRINLDGSTPLDNPFAKSPIYSYGHRDPQGLSWDINNRLYEAEHGEIGHDEINIIQKGANYGWPIIQGDQTFSGGNKMLKPLIHSGEETWAPSGIAYIKQGPWRGKLLVANLLGQQLLAFTFNEDGTILDRKEVLLKNKYGRIREVIQSKDGSIYITTSNMNGRGKPNPGDDKILRLVAKKQKEAL
ncbi:MAG: glucose sorbosone dehydrogenase [Bacillales bacterium]|jgi:glucose/arabinose dehydrogenase|nr:glucose sorbosone dehydrogenase [Bacillales bacterium]